MSPPRASVKRHLQPFSPSCRTGDCTVTQPRLGQKKAATKRPNSPEPAAQCDLRDLTLVTDRKVMVMTHCCWMGFTQRVAQQNGVNGLVDSQEDPCLFFQECIVPRRLPSCSKVQLHHVVRGMFCPKIDETLVFGETVSAVTQTNNDCAPTTMIALTAVGVRPVGRPQTLRRNARRANTPWDDRTSRRRRSLRVT